MIGCPSKCFQIIFETSLVLDGILLIRLLRAKEPIEKIRNTYLSQIVYRIAVCVVSIQDGFHFSERAGASGRASVSLCFDCDGRCRLYRKIGYQGTCVLQRDKLPYALGYFSCAEQHDPVFACGRLCFSGSYLVPISQIRVGHVDRA